VVAAEVYEPEGSARLELVSGVALLREEDALVEAMLTGWAKQQLGGRGLAEKTVKRRQGIVRRFLEFSNEYPWHWTAAHLDEWSADLVCVLGRAKSTIRSYHDVIRSFDSYLNSELRVMLDEVSSAALAEAMASAVGVASRGTGTGGFRRSSRHRLDLGRGLVSWPAHRAAPGLPASSSM